MGFKRNGTLAPRTKLITLMSDIRLPKGKCQHATKFITQSFHKNLKEEWSACELSFFLRDGLRELYYVLYSLALALALERERELLFLPVGNGTVTSTFLLQYRIFFSEQFCNGRRESKKQEENIVIRICQVSQPIVSTFSAEMTGSFLREEANSFQNNTDCCTTVNNW